MLKRNTLLLIITFGHFAILFGQAKLEVIVVDEEGIPITEAIIFRFNKENKSILQSVFVDSVGYINLGNVDYSRESIKITAIGYQGEEIADASPEEILRVILSPLSINLSEVVIMDKSTVNQRSDRLVFNITNENLVKGNNTLQLLKFTPLVQTDGNKVTIMGDRPADIYINGRKTNLPEDALQSYLQSLPADRISSIEVITNPGVAYKLANNQGIINLVLKKDDAEGIKGSLSVGTTQNNRNSQYGSLYLDYQKDKLNLTANIYPSNDDGSYKNITDYYYYNTNRHDNVYSKTKSKYLYVGGNVRADYHLSEDHTLGMIIDGSYNKGRGKESANTIFSHLETNNIDSIYSSYNNTNRPAKRVTVNLNYRAKISKKGDFSFDFDYLRNERDNSIANYFYRQKGGRISAMESRFKQKSEDLTDSYSAKAEYKHKFNAYHNLTFGSDFYYALSKSDFSHDNLVDGQYLPDLGKNNSFEYNEALISGYVSYGWRLNDMVNGIAGVRIENVNGEGNQKITREKAHRDYFDALPSLSIMYAINTNHKLSYNFALGAFRPSFYSLNTFKFFITPTTYRENNPNLKASKSYTNRLLYTLNNRYTFAVSYQYLSQCRNDFQIPVDDEYTKLINANYGDLHRLSFNWNWSDSFIDDCLYVKVSANGDYRRDKGAVETIVIDNSAFSYNFSLNSNWTISKKQNWNVGIDCSYWSKSKIATQNSNGSFNMSVEFRKMFPKDISLNFGVRGLLRTRGISQKTYDNYRFNTRSDIHYETAFINLSIPFGNQKTKGAQSRGTSSSKASSRLSE